MRNHSLILVTVSSLAWLGQAAWTTHPKSLNSKQASLIYCRKLNYHLPYEVHKAFLSPDKKCAALATEGDGEMVRLSLYRWDNLHGRLQGKCIFSYQDVEGFAWRPGTGHELLYGLGGDRWPEKVGIYSWDNREHCLVRGQENRWLALAAVSGPGDYLLYEYWPHINSNSNFSIKKLNLRAPKPGKA